MHLGADLDDPLLAASLFEAYDRYLDVGASWLVHTGHSGYGGAITAALFLRRFVGQKADWAHIDVMAWNLSSRPWRPKGGEAMGLRTLFAFIQERQHNLAPKKSPKNIALKILPESTAAALSVDPQIG